MTRNEKTLFLGILLILACKNENPEATESNTKKACEGDCVSIEDAGLANNLDSLGYENIMER